MTRVVVTNGPEARLQKKRSESSHTLLSLSTKKKEMKKGDDISHELLLWRRRVIRLEKGEKIKTLSGRITSVARGDCALRKSSSSPKGNPHWILEKGVHQKGAIVMSFGQGNIPGRSEITFSRTRGEEYVLWGGKRTPVDAEEYQRKRMGCKLSRRTRLKEKSRAGEGTASQITQDIKKSLQRGGGT